MAFNQPIGGIFSIRILLTSELDPFAKDVDA